MWRKISGRGTLISILWFAGTIPQYAFAQDVLLRSPLNPSVVINHYKLDPVYTGSTISAPSTMSGPPRTVGAEEDYKSPLQINLGILMEASKIKDKINEQVKEFLEEIITNSPKLWGIAKTIPRVGKIGAWTFVNSTKLVTEGVDSFVEPSSLLLSLAPTNPWGWYLINPVGWLLIPSSIAPEERAFGSPERGFGGLDRGPGGPVDFGGPTNHERYEVIVGPLERGNGDEGSKDAGSNGEGSKDPGSKDPGSKDPGSKDKDNGDGIKNDTGPPG